MPDAAATEALRTRGSAASVVVLAGTKVRYVYNNQDLTDLNLWHKEDDDGGENS